MKLYKIHQKMSIKDHMQISNDVAQSSVDRNRKFINDISKLEEDVSFLVGIAYVIKALLAVTITIGAIYYFKTF